MALSFNRDATDRVYVIAEVGVNHDGSVDDAHRLVDLAADCGADSVKFQTFDPAAIVSGLAEAAPYQRELAQVSTQQELLARYVLPDSAWGELAAHSRERGLDFMSTTVDTASLDLITSLDVQALKIGSGELTNKPFLVETAQRGLAVILSTGMGTMQEVRDAVGWLEGVPQLMLLHCVSSYPAPAEQANLRAIPTMRDEFNVAVGWSDHTVGNVSAVAAVAIGAASLEKHITLDKHREGPDHMASADAEEFTDYVRAVRQAYVSLGDGIKVPVPSEMENRPLVRRSWHARHALEAGHVLTAGDVVTLRPAAGLEPSFDIIGHRTSRSLAAGAAIVADDLD
ncbi:N-acetylneuraminate synthase family protein [Humibacillus xanthopallidus]|uniref:N-acetylneuraminate synthase family protein n=1 Tax=Humibacillus xanthopallidus TaxID=412689 RepID=UPI00384AF014